MKELQLHKPKNIQDILTRHGHTAKKSLGQNFLIDGNIIRHILDKSGLTPQDLVIEVGPGIGTLTEAIATRAHKVIAIEKDDDLIPILEETLAPRDNIEVIHGDVLDVDLASLIAKEKQGRDVRVIANLPYYITTPILAMLLEAPLPIKSLTVMVQKEVGERIVAKPGSKDISPLSLLCQYYSDPAIIQQVPASVFMPRPKVDSVVVHMAMKEKLDDPYRDPMFALIHKAYTKRRKTLPNAGEGAWEGLSKEAIRQALAAIGQEETARPEALGLEEWRALLDHLA